MSDNLRRYRGDRKFKRPLRAAPPAPPAPTCPACRRGLQPSGARGRTVWPGTTAGEDWKEAVMNDMLEHGDVATREAFLIATLH
jgi:hypothetical protein